jgi:hypothetical protein
MDIKKVMKFWNVAIHPDTSKHQAGEAFQFIRRELENGGKLLDFFSNFDHMTAYKILHRPTIINKVGSNFGFYGIGSAYWSSHQRYIPKTTGRTFGEFLDYMNKELGLSGSSLTKGKYNEIIVYEVMTGDWMSVSEIFTKALLMDELLLEAEIRSAASRLAKRGRVLKGLNSHNLVSFMLDN